MKRWQQLCSAFLLAAAASAAPAATYNNGTATATFTVSLTLQANCSITANPLSFGTTGVLSSAINQQTTVAVTCTNTTPYNVGLNAGSGTGSTITSRLMSGTGANTSTVAYTLKQTSGGANWGNTQGTDTVSGTGTGSSQSLTVYGNIPAQATPQPDAYKSTITATVYF